MADYPMRHPPEDFFFYPASPTAMIMEEYCSSPGDFRSSTWSANAVPVTPPSNVIQLKPGKKTPEAAATIRDLVDEPIFWRGYTSDEEVASPLVGDNNSLDSNSFCYDSEDVVSLYNAPSPQRSAQSLDEDKQHVTHAHAVQFTSAGKAKVVSMPTPTTIRTAPSSPTGPARSSASRMNVQGRTINFSRTITPKVSSESGADDGTDKRYGYFPDPKKTIRRKPDVPALQTAWRSHGLSAPVTPRSARRAGFIEPTGSAVASPLSEAAWFSQSNTPDEERPSSQLRQLTTPHRNSEPEPYPAQEASPVPDSPPFSSPHHRSDSKYMLQGHSSPQRTALRSDSSQYTREAYNFPDSSRPRLLRKLSSTLSFKSFTRPIRRDSFSSNDSTRLQPVSEMDAKSVHATSAVHIPSRTSSKPLPKMVPRGANERAPPVVIPPCPEDYEDDDDDVPARWPQKKASALIGTTPLSNDGEMAAIETTTTTSNKLRKAPHQRSKSHSTSSGSGSS